MNAVLLIGLIALFVFTLGVLTGHGYTTREQDQRDRRQAATQRELSFGQRDLSEMAKRQAAREDELRWRYLEQAGLVVAGHDTAKEVAVAEPRQVRRSER